MNNCKVEAGHNLGVRIGGNQDFRKMTPFGLGEIQMDVNSSCVSIIMMKYATQIVIFKDSFNRLITVKIELNRFRKMNLLFILGTCITLSSMLLTSFGAEMFDMVIKTTHRMSMNAAARALMKRTLLRNLQLIMRMSGDKMGTHALRSHSRTWARGLGQRAEIVNIDFQQMRKSGLFVCAISERV